jgi:hypothetical protein
MNDADDVLKGAEDRNGTRAGPLRRKRAFL